MKKYLFKDAKFIKTAMLPKDYPSLQFPEIAVVGRSNVGKSTLLNHLFRSKGLVKTSSTPGKTQAVNFFTLNEALTFVDLPGYGYATVPGDVKKTWGPMIQRYLEERKNLKLILFLLDIRRVPSIDDIQFLQWAAFNEKAIILVITKADKLKTHECKKNTDVILKSFDFENLNYVQYSAPANQGRDTLIRLIHEALEDESCDL